MASGPRKSWFTEEDDDYWSSSTKGYDFGDDLPNLKDARKIVGDLQKDADVNDQSEVVNWDGSAAITFEKSARYHPPQVPTSTPPKPLGQQVSNHNLRQESPPARPAVPHSVSADTFKQNHSRSASLGKFDNTPTALRSSGSEPSIDDVVKTSIKAPSVAEHAKVQSQVNSLKRQLENSKRDRWASIPVEETVKRMVNGESYSLEMYKSKADKLSLIDAAVAIHDGNTIMAAVLFMKNTIKPSIFNRELMRRPVACDHYLNYLRMHHDFEELVDMLGVLGRTEEAAILKFQHAISSTSQEKKIKNLKTCLYGHFSNDPTLTLEADLVQQQVNLLERQLPIEADDSKAEQLRSHPVIREHPRARSLVDMSVMTTLYYCCFYHYDLAENYLASPKALCKAHRLTDKQFTTTALRALAKLRRWMTIDQLFETKNWLGKSQMKSPMGFIKVVDILLKNNANPEVLSKYLHYIEDPDDRVAMATKCQAHMVVIETLKALKDREQLVKYQRKLEGGQHTREMSAIQTLLQNPSIKWKT